MKATLFKHTNDFNRGWQDESTYKIFPFYTHQCLSKSNKDPFELVCDKCGCNIEGNHSVKCGDFVFYDPNTVKVYCWGGCRPPGVIKYENQVYGFKKPVELPKHLYDSLLHTTVWRYLYESDKYKLNRFLGRKVSVEFLQKEFSSLFPSYSVSSGPGMPCFQNQNGFITVARSLNIGRDLDVSEEVNTGRSIRYSKKSKDAPDTMLKISPGMMAEVIEEIINPQQLVIF